VFHQYTIGVGSARDEIVAEMKDAGVICGIYYPIPCHRQAYVQELGIEADLPITDAARPSSMSLPMYPGLTEAEQDQVIAAAAGHRSSATPVATGDRSVTRALAARPRRPGLDGPEPPPGHLRPPGHDARPRSRTRIEAALEAAVGSDRRAGLRDPLAMIAEAELDGVVIAAPTTAHVALALAAIERGLSVLVEKPLAATVDDGLAIVAAARRRRPVQVGHVERYNPAVLEMGRLLRAGWLSTVYAITSRRAGPFPARIRDVGVTIDLAPTTWTCCPGSPASGPSASTPRRRSGSTPPRGPHLRAHALPVRSHRLPRRGLADARQAPQLTVVGEEGMFELDYLTQKLTFTRSNVERPQLIGGYATTFTGDVAEIPVSNVEPLAPSSMSSSASSAPASGRTSTARTACGRWPSPTPCSTAAAERRPIDLSDLPSRLAAE
jgi:hypothetical protein